MSDGAGANVPKVFRPRQRDRCGTTVRHDDVGDRPRAAEPRGAAVEQPEHLRFVVDCDITTTVA
jgi:hypothetical protein